MIILIYTFICFTIATTTTTGTAFIGKEQQRQVHSTYNNFDPCCCSHEGTIRWKHSIRSTIITSTTKRISSLTMTQLQMNNNKNYNDDDDNNNTTINPKSETLQSFLSDTNVSNNDSIDTTTSSTFNILQSTSQEKDETDLSIVPIPMFTGILILFGSLYITFYGFYVGLYGFPSENDTTSISSVLPRIF